MTELTVLFNSSGNIVYTRDVLGSFVANTGGDDSFQRKYKDDLVKITKQKADESEIRLSIVQIAMGTAQIALFRAQEWLTDKTAVVQSSNSAFQQSINSLEHANPKLKDAKISLGNAQINLIEAERKMDSLCEIKTCRMLCIPGIRCRRCWFRFLFFFLIPYRCCYRTNCLHVSPEPFCAAYNTVCKAVRGIAYLNLGIAERLVYIHITVLDDAKLLISNAQFVVDKSRVALDIARDALDQAQIRLQATESILEGTKMALEAVKKVTSWGIKALNFMNKYGSQNMIDVKNCSFEIKRSMYDTMVLYVDCDINVLQEGYKKVKLGVNFGSPLQSIWQAAKGTIETIIDVSRHISESEKREVKYEVLSGIHKVIRKVRNVSSSSDDFDSFINDTINTLYNTDGFNGNFTAGEYDNRVQLFQAKCSVMNNVMSFFTDALQVLFEMSNETASSLNNASSIEESLGNFDLDLIASNCSIDNIGINTDVAMSNFNMSVDDINVAMQEAKENLTNDPLLSGISNLTREAKIVLKNQREDAESINIIDYWILAMENVTFEYFSNGSCISFLDCSHFAVFQLYGLFDAEYVENMSKSLNEISRFEDNFLDLLGNTSYTVVEVYNRIEELQISIDEINDCDVFCSEPPKILPEIGNHNVTAGSTLRLFCNATGNPKPQIWWYQNDKYMPNQTDQLLVIYDVRKSDESRYHCIAGNLIANLTSEYAEVFVYTDGPELHIPTNQTFNDDFIHGNTRESTEPTNLAMILGTTFGILLFIVGTGVGFAGRLYVRKRSRKAIRTRFITNLNVVRPSDSKPKFNTNLVAVEASSN